MARVAPPMNDLLAKLENLFAEGEDCELVAKLATIVRNASSSKDSRAICADWLAISK
jgi:hypothetical protein